MDAPLSALVADEGVVGKHSRRRNPELESRVDATLSSAAEGVDAAISAWVAEECNRSLGQELSEDGERLHVAMAPDAKEKELNLRKQFKVSKPHTGR